ncbi:hypothetical protein Tco_0134668 [Tanacetum coccineum]
MWSPVPIIYDKHALWAISHWGRKRQHFYGYAVNRKYARDVYSRNTITNIWNGSLFVEMTTSVTHSKKAITIDFPFEDIEDMLLLLVQGKLTNLNIEEHRALGVSLRMFTRSIVIKRHVEDLQLGIESYQKKLNLTKPDTLMRIDELHKFSDGTLNDVRSALDDTLKRIWMKYMPHTI